MDINVITALTVLAPISIGAFYFSRLFVVARILWFFILITGGMELSMWFQYSKSINTMFFFHIYSYIEFGFIALIYYRLSMNYKWRSVILGLFSLFSIASILNLIFLEPFTVFNSNQRYLEGVLILLLVSNYIIQSTKDKLNSSLKRDPFTILSLAWLVYFSCTLILFIFSKQWFSAETINYYWIVHAILNAGLNFSYAYTLFKAKVIAE